MKSPLPAWCGLRHPNQHGQTSGGSCVSPTPLLWRGTGNHRTGAGMNAHRRVRTLAGRSLHALGLMFWSYTVRLPGGMRSILKYLQKRPSNDELQSALTCHEFITH